jgi:hypothetical protein
MTGPICRPGRDERASDPFGFGDADMQRQAVRNLLVLVTLPWTAAFALAAEFASLGLGRRG